MTNETCSTCTHWKTIHVQGNERSEPAMIKLGYRNCLVDKSVVGAGRYLHSEAKGCGKFAAMNITKKGE